MTPPTDGEQLTIDELAQRTGTTVRTVRFYCTEGLLPPPRRQGRIAYYGATHRMRLELVRTLQDHGYTLAAIDRALQRIPLDASPAQYAVQAAVLAPWLPEATDEFDHVGLERRAGRALDGEAIDFLIGIAVLERIDGGRYRANASSLGLGLQALDLPVPVELLRKAGAVIEEHAEAVARGLTEVFVEGIWGRYRSGEIDHEELAAMIGVLRPLAVQGLVSRFAHAADRVSRPPTE